MIITIIDKFGKVVTVFDPLAGVIFLFFLVFGDRGDLLEERINTILGFTLFRLNNFLEIRWSFRSRSSERLSGFRVDSPASS